MVPHHVHGEVKGTLLSATGSDSEPGKFKLLGSDFEASFLQVLLWFDPISEKVFTPY